MRLRRVRSKVSYIGKPSTFHLHTLLLSWIARHDQPVDGFPGECGARNGEKDRRDGGCSNLPLTSDYHIKSLEGIGDTVQHTVPSAFKTQATTHTSTSEHTMTDVQAHAGPSGLIKANEVIYCNGGCLLRA